jgi:integrase
MPRHPVGVRSFTERDGPTINPPYFYGGTGGVNCFCDHFDASVPSAKRGYAMVRCLVDLGLRSSEVIHLQLDDIDWRNGVIRLAKG